MSDGPIEIESALPDVSDLDLAALERLNIPALARATARVRQAAADPDSSWSGFNSSAKQ